jgi:heterodisulfide reductase subunit A-like polyferredoxin
MNNRPNIGVFLCQCGSQIEPLIDLNTLKQEMEQQHEYFACSWVCFS